MKTLILGSGGREHAIAFRILQDDSCDTVFVMPGNPGMKRDGISIIEGNFSDFSYVKEVVERNEIDYVFVGPEGPLELGIVDYLIDNGIRVVGPKKEASLLESSKSYSKDFMKKYEIPTARYEVFDSYEKAIEGLSLFQEGKAVVKASKLAGGKGVVVSESHDEAKKALYDFLKNPECTVNTDKVVIEERLEGEEISAFALFDENGFINLGFARDYKRVLDNNQGPNTGGMGTFSSEELVDEKLKNFINEEVFNRVHKGMKEEGCPFTGILFAGLMVNEGDVKVIEFNVRFGDPEAQSIMPRIKGDLNLTFYNQSYNRLSESISFDSRSAVHVVMCSKNYPSIDGTRLDVGHQIEISKNVDNAKVFYAGVREVGSNLLNSGGRVLGVTALGDSIKDARGTSYQQIVNISFKNAHFRKDIALES